MPTPLSPLPANVALTAFDQYGMNHFGWNDRNKIYPIVRYADDFIIICKTESEAQFIKKEIKRFLHDPIGRQLSDEKTHITEITKGLDFLGFHLKKYTKQIRKPDRKTARMERETLLTKPAPEKIQTHLYPIQKVRKKMKTAPQNRVIRKRNPLIRGWANSDRKVVSQKVFVKIDPCIWWKRYRWAKRRPPNKSKRWIINRDFSKPGNRKGIFKEKGIPTRIFDMASIPIRRHVQLSKDARVSDGNPQTLSDWHDRESQRAKAITDGGSMTRKLRVKPKGICTDCKKPLTAEKISNGKVDKHPIKPKAYGGAFLISNPYRLHADGHREIHGRLTLEEMMKLLEGGITDDMRLKPDYDKKILITSQVNHSSL